MDDILLNTLLFDCYSNLLTDKQRRVCSMRWQEDMSLAEIAEECGITPQAASDLLGRTLKKLKDYEIKLGLVANIKDTDSEASYGI